MPADTEPGNATWLYDFFSRGIQSAYAEYTLALPQPATVSSQYYRQLYYSIEYLAEEKTYEVRFTYEYRDSWEVLTHNGSMQPPRQEIYFTGSRIQPWTNSNGLGMYAEKYLCPGMDNIQTYNEAQANTINSVESLIERITQYVTSTPS